MHMDETKCPRGHNYHMKIYLYIFRNIFVQNYDILQEDIIANIRDLSLLICIYIFNLPPIIKLIYFPIRLK